MKKRKKRRRKIKDKRKRRKKKLPVSRRRLKVQTVPPSACITEKLIRLSKPRRAVSKTVS
jgi:hypothetical protein